MKFKRFVAIVISLAMVLSIVPAFSLTASAANETIDGVLPLGAVKVFDGGAGGKSVVGTPSGDTPIATVYGDTWSSSWTGESNKSSGSGMKNINVVTSNDRVQTQYAIQSYDSAGNETWVKTTAGYGATSDWFAFDYISTLGSVIKDIALLGYNPTTGTEVVIDQFRSGNRGDYVGFYPTGSSAFTTTGTLTASEDIATTGYVDWGIYRILVEKGDGIYTVSYYHATFENRDKSYTFLGKKTYSGDITGVGFGGLSLIASETSQWYTNMRFWEPVVWADGVAEGNVVATVDMKSFTQVGSTIVSGTISVAGKNNYVERINGTTYGGGTPEELGSARYAQLKFDVPKLDIKKVTLRTRITRVHNYLKQGQWMRLGVYSGAVTPSSTNTNYLLSEEKVYGANNANTVYNSVIHTDITNYITAGTENTITISVPYSAFAIESTPQLVVEYTPAATQKTIVATYTAGGKTVHTVEKLIDTAETSAASFDEYYYSVNGTNTLYHAAAQSLSESATIEMTALENWSQYPVGTEFTNNGTPYKVISANLVPNGNFAEGINGWYAADGSAASASNFTTDASAGSVYLVGNGGSSSPLTIQRSWAIENGKTYTFVYTQSQAGTDKKWQRFSLGNDFKSNNDCMLSGAGAGDVETGQSVVEGTNLVTFTNTGNYKYANFVAAWSGGVTLSNFGLYEVEIDTAKVANTTIKFVDSTDGTTEIADSVTITGIVGDVIDLSAYAEAITYNGNPYSFDSTNPTSYTVTGNTDTVTLTYTTDAYVSFTAAAVTVIEGNDPVMPTTVTAVTGAGSSTEVSGAVWTGCTGLSAGTHTINGTVEIAGTTVSGSTTVTVLPMTFETGNITGSGTVNFPVDVTGDFYLEYDLTASDYDNLWIYHSADGALWGGGQIGLGWDADGTGYFRAQPAEQTKIQFTTNNTYRFLIHGNVDTDTYDLVVYDTVTKAVVFTCDDYAFRTNSDVINSIVVSANGQSGSANLTNIKVYAPAQADLFTTYTVAVAGAGDNDGTYTTTAVSAEGVEIPYFKGYIFKTRVVDGETITYTYEETEVSLGSWAIRNNVVDEAYITEMKYLGSHNAFANTSTAVTNEGLYLNGKGKSDVTIMLKAAATSAIGTSRAQELDALDQLNAGVRFFDIRLTRQSDGTFWTFHGPAFAEFRPIAATMAQFAAENPGEVIILDFQEMWDALYETPVSGGNNGGDAGDDNEDYYAALEALLKETGLWDYMPDNWDQRYGAITNSGEKAVVIPISKARGASCIDKFINRGEALSDTTTYVESSDFETVVNKIQSAVDAGQFGSGAKLGTIHAYLTGSDLLSLAESYNGSWINQNLDAWMAKGYGDVFMMNGITKENAAPILERLSEYNRDYMNDLIGSEIIDYDYNWVDDGKDGLTVGGVTLTGSTTSMPFSTKFVVTSGDASQIPVMTIEGVEYTPVTAYVVALKQFDTNSVQPTGEVTLTFPVVSADTTTYDVLLSADGQKVLATAARGAAVSYTTEEIGSVILATANVPYEDVEITLMSDGEEVDTYTLRVYEGDEVKVPAGIYGKQYYLDDETAATEDNGVYTVEVAPLTMFTWNETKGTAMQANGEYNAAMIVNWNNDSDERYGFAYATVPELKAGQAAFITMEVCFNNGYYDDGVPVVDFYKLDAEALKAIDLNGGTDVTAAINELYTEDDKIATVDLYKAVGGSANTYQKNIKSDTNTKTHAVVRIPVELDAGEIAIKMIENETEAGIAVVRSFAIEARYAVTVDNVTEYYAEGEELKHTLAEGKAVLVDADGKIYAPEDGVVTITVDSALTLTSKALGVSMVNGAQVRIGGGVTADGKVATGSGLRFITTVNYSNTLAARDEAVLGVEITGEGSDIVTDIVAKTFQDDDKTVFTSALTSLAVGNYNRRFTATPYVKIGDAKYYGDAVTRSIYQVSAGLLANDGSQDTPDNTALENDIIYKVLNAYVNQTGIRLAINESKEVAIHDADSAVNKGGKYTGNAFFTLEDASYDNGVYTIVIKPVGEHTEIKDYWKDYIRINNNNSIIKDYTTLVSNDEAGTATITFDYATFVEETNTTEE